MAIKWKYYSCTMCAARSHTGACLYRTGHWYRKIPKVPCEAVRQFAEWRYFNEH